MPHENGKVMSQKDHRVLAQLTLQHDERIDQLFDLLLELKLAAIEAGWPMKDAQAVRDAVLRRQKGAGVLDMQRQRLRKDLGLD